MGAPSTRESGSQADQRPHMPSHDEPPACEDPCLHFRRNTQRALRLVLPTFGTDPLCRTATRSNYSRSLPSPSRIDPV